MNCHSERSEESKGQANEHNAFHLLMAATPSVIPAESLPRTRYGAGIQSGQST